MGKAMLIPMTRPEPFIFRVRDGSHYVSFLDPADVFQSGLPAEAIIGQMVGGKFTPKNWRLNRRFLDFLHKIVREAGPRNLELVTIAKQQVNGWIDIIDLRTPKELMDKMSPQNIIGSFEIKDGQLNADGYRPCDAYLVFNEHGFLHPPTSQHNELMAGLKQLTQKKNPLPVSNASL